MLKHWACAKIDKSAKVADEADEDEVCRTIVRKFEEIAKSSQGMGDGTGVSYADIAKRAWAIGKAGLATKVLLFWGFFVSGRDCC